MSVERNLIAILAALFSLDISRAMIQLSRSAAFNGKRARISTEGRNLDGRLDRNSALRGKV